MERSDVLQLIAHQWIYAFNRKDVEGILRLYADNAEHYSPKLKLRHPETKGLIQGKAAMRSWWEDSFVRFPQLRYDLVRLTCSDDRVFMEYVRKANGEEDMYVGEMLEVGDGEIVRSRVFHS